ncbi:MAG: carboxypeptidase regulatory-like domain-containing protein, partial [Gemmatimonadales bacterium]
GLGFQTREIVVDSVLEIKETLQPCASYEDLPQPWTAIEPSGSRIIGVAVADDRVMVAVMDLEGIISVWNTRQARLVKRFPSEESGNLIGGWRIPMEFSHDGKRLAVAGADGVVRLWNPLTGQRIWWFPPIDTVAGSSRGRKVPAMSAGFEFNQSGTLLASMVAGKVAFWSTVSGKRVGTFKEGYWTSKLLFLGDSSFIASADSGRMKIYPRLGAPSLWTVRIPVTQFNLMSRSPDGRWLVVKSYTDTAYLWSLSEGQLAKVIAMPQGSFEGVMAFSPDGGTVATLSGANGLYLWDTKTGQPVRSFQKLGFGVQKAWFTADGRSIVTYAIRDTVFRVVHLDLPVNGFGARVAAEPVQAFWGGNSWAPPRTPDGSLGSIAGFVRDSAKKAIVGAEVEIFDGEHPGSASLATTSTNAAGRFLLQAIKVPHVTVRAWKRGFAAKTGYAHLPAEEAGVSFELSPDRAPGVEL